MHPFFSKNFSESIFWSHHGFVPDCQCDKSIRVSKLILDGHQKPRRTICSFENVTSLVNEEELGACNRGCPYQPQKKNNNSNNKNKNSPYYCYYHQNANEKSSSNIEEDRQRDQAWKNQLKLLQEQSNVTDGDETCVLCNVIRSDENEQLDNKRRSMGFLASFLSCGVVVGFTESINHEGVRQVTDHLLTMIKMRSKIPDALIYDAACNLKLFWNKNYRGEHLKDTPASTKLFNMRVAVDRFHHKNHVHSMCKTITNPNCAANGNDEVYKGINTGIAEQSFRYLSEFKLSLRRFAYPTSTIFSILLLHLWNCRRTNRSPDSFGLATQYMSEKIKPRFLTCCIFETAQVCQKKSDAEFVNVIPGEQQQNSSGDEMEIGDDDIEQLNYNCFTNLQQYAWDSEEE
ncbi:unnamed protein product [Rotaria magnacalcarata]|uniref:Uncharacterized protein n=1 Tax=Rotaria magnacalcarata TaxID=392030 RepID=A0A816WX34_9BILA|nr:unnamed protein product [Rotaria magnacalcarata]CAF3979676.1 unnamed protein product [Rotaria magnacalcarata]CAF4012956.1 unnamed protein product [Rotaria magnacalcarata]